MKIVKFNDGKYGIRRWTLFGLFEFKDVQNTGYNWWHSKGASMFRNCRGEKEEVERIYDLLTDYGEAVED